MKRYNFNVSDQLKSHEADDGKYVKYEDVACEIEDLKKIIDSYHRLCMHTDNGIIKIIQNMMEKL